MNLDPARAAAELAARRRRYPIAYHVLWHSRQTSQRTALLPLAEPTTKLLAILGGNRSGKSALMAAYLVACAMGRDYVVRERHGDVYPVKMWLRRNALPDELIPEGPGDVWAGSPDFGSACEQIRPHITAVLPEGSRLVGWGRDGPAKVLLPNGGRIISKAYSQYHQKPQTWEGASNVRAIGLDEQPDSYSNLLAALARLIDERGKLLNALTPLRGRRDWFYREIASPKAQAANPDYRIVHLYGEDNPNIPQDERAKTIAKYPAWQRAARDRGEFVDAEGMVYPMQTDVHVVDGFTPPKHWIRFMSIDWGGRAPHVLWAALAKGPHQVGDRMIQEGDLVCYREFAPRLARSEPRLTQDALIDEIIRQETAADERGASTIYRVADSEDPNAIDNAAVRGLACEPVRKGRGVMTHGIGLVEGMLQTAAPAPGGAVPVRPTLYFCRTCPVTIEEMMDLRWPENSDEGDADERKPEDGADHGPDCVRYMAQYMEEQGW
jgi:hypothetical protein